MWSISPYPSSDDKIREAFRESSKTSTPMIVSGAKTAFGCTSALS